MTSPPAQAPTGPPSGAQGGPAADPPGTESTVRPVSPADRVWATLGRELTPAQSLERMDTATDRVVRTVTIIGTLLGGFGVFGAAQPSVAGPARWLTIGAVVCAVLAVGCALAAQILTISKHVNPENLAQVRAWYKRRVETRGYPTRAATFLLLVAAVLAGAAAVVALVTAAPNEPTIAVTRALDRPTATLAGPATSTITADVTFRGLSGGQGASITVTAAGSPQVLASAAVTAGPDGTASRALTVTGVPAAEPVVVAARAGTEQCRARLSAGPVRPVITCGTAGPG
jgi:hypothetical protein